MPRGDGTGPFGQGAMTGRGEGYCGYGRGLGCNPGAPRFWGRPGIGRGRGLGIRYQAGSAYDPADRDPVPRRTLGPEQEVSLLQSEADRLRSVLQGIERRLAELQST
jgi:hypothetical protein